MKAQRVIITCVLLCSGCLTGCIFFPFPEEPDKVPSWQRITDYDNLKGAWVLVRCFRHSSAQGGYASVKDSVYNPTDSVEVITFNTPGSNIDKCTSDSIVTGSFSVAIDTFTDGGFRSFIFIYPDTSVLHILSDLRFIDIAYQYGSRNVYLDVYARQDSLKIEWGQCAGSQCLSIERLFVRVP